MKKLLLILLCGTLLLSITACKKPGNVNPLPDDSSVTDESMDMDLVPDPLINRFITEYNAQSKMTLHSYVRGETTNEYKGIANECDITITSKEDDVNPELRVSIMGGTTEESWEKMMAVFVDVAQVVDEYVSKTTLQEAVDYLTAQTAPLSNYRFCGYMMVETYMPIVDNGTGIVPCRIDLVGYQYFAE